MATYVATLMVLLLVLSEVYSRDAQNQQRFRKSPALTPCPPGLVACRNGQGCIPRPKVCNGQTDCVDGSDELNCNMAACCPAGQFICLDRGCASLQQVCDGINNCADGSDEANCNKITCPPGLVACDSGTQCIPRPKVCNGVANCLDGSDEQGCAG